MNKSLFTAAWKRIVPVFLAALLVFSFAVTVSAGTFDDFYDYENPDGTYSYYFTRGVVITMDKDWYQKTMVLPTDNGATFYHKASYYAWQEKGLEGGRLFTISASVNTDFQNLPSFEYIGFNEEECMNYFAILPTDYQAYEADAGIRAEYDSLWAGVKDVIAGIELKWGSDSYETVDGGEEISGGDENSGEDVIIDEDSLFTTVGYEDDFSFEIPSGWESWASDGPNTVFASKDGSEMPPIIFIQDVGQDVSAGDYAVELKNAFLDRYRDGVAVEPELITYEPEGTDRKLAGFRGVYSSMDDSRKYTVLEYVEYVGEDLYHYYCCYVSETKVEGEYEDETTYFEFHNAIDTMQVS